MAVICLRNLAVLAVPAFAAPDQASIIPECVDERTSATEPMESNTASYEVPTIMDVDAPFTASLATESSVTGTAISAVEAATGGDDKVRHICFIDLIAALD